MGHDGLMIQNRRWSDKASTSKSYWTLTKGLTLNWTAAHFAWPVCDLQALEKYEYTNCPENKNAAL